VASACTRAITGTSSLRTLIISFEQVANSAW
jgi:hypothetical protein